MDKEVLFEREAKARKLESSPEEFRRFLDLVSRTSEHFLTELPRSKAYEEKYYAPESLQPCGFDDAFHELTRLLEGGINAASGRFMGYIPGGGVPTAAIGDFIAALFNRFSGAKPTSPGSFEIEASLIRFLIELFQLPESSWGNLTSGGSIATLIAVLSARETRPQPEWASGTLYATSENHACVKRALKMAGLAHLKLHEVSVDKNFRMDAADLRSLIESDIVSGRTPWMVFANAGTTNTGAMDPLKEIAALCKKYQIWFHVDAAYGGFFALTDRLKSKFEPLRDANSIVLDPHKGLFMPYGIGAVLIRDRKLMQTAFFTSAHYAKDAHTEERNSPMEISPELTRPFRGARLWLTLKTYGLEPFRAALEEKLMLAEYAYERISRMAGITVGPKPELTVIVFRKNTDAETEDFLRRINDTGKTFVSPTQLNGQLYIRMCILNFRTHLKEVEEALELISKL